MNTKNIPEWIKRDALYIIVILFALLACVYTIYLSTDCQQKCNENWIEQLEDSGCFMSDTNEIEWEFINGIEDTNYYTERPGNQS